ncbi:hypothetical protein HDV04_005995 [Boothiomyces sp. JEL0838]|nr:hypothetical protein HDV04_005995 [Boothiomyces sp. JEL0838]
MENALAAYAVQSHWLTSECQNTPDFILGTPNVAATIPFSGLVMTGPGYCGDMWIADCSHAGVCMASLDLGLSFGYKSFQDSYFNTVPTFNQWVYPVDTTGNYCKIAGVNETALLLASSSVCWQGFKCGHSNITAYEFANCTGPSNAVITMQQSYAGYSLSFVTLSSGTEKIVWTTYITLLLSVLEAPEPLWSLSLALIIISIALVFIHLLVSLYKYYQTKRWNFIAFCFGYILSIIEFITVFLCFTQGAISGIYPNLFYGLSSGFTMALNGILLMEIACQTRISRIAVGLLVFLLYFFFGLPYVVYAIIANSPPTASVVFLESYFNVISYPVWQILCAIADSVIPGIIIGYIMKACLVQQTVKSSTVVRMLVTDYKLVAIFVVSLVNFFYITFLQLATTYTMYARSDKIMTMYQTVFSLQHAVSAICTLWYTLHFPIVLDAGRKLAKKIESIKSSHKEGKENTSGDLLISVRKSASSPLDGF